jgi:hypothetical protein
MDNLVFALGAIVAIIGGVLMIQAIKLQHPQRLYRLVAIVFFCLLPSVGFDIFAGSRDGTLYCLSWLLVMCVGSGGYLKHRGY